MIEFVTERLIIRELTLNDAPFILDLLNDKDFKTFIGDKGVENIVDAENYITNGPISSFLEFGFGLMNIILKDTNVSIGINGLLKRDYLDIPDIGFAFLPNYRSKGYAYESAEVIIKSARNNLDILDVCAIINPKNKTSIRLINKLGLSLKKEIEIDGKITNLYD